MSDIAPKLFSHAAFHTFPFVLSREGKRHQPFTRTLRVKTSIKDVVETCGVPHPEIDFLVCNGVSVTFDHQLEDAAIVQVYGTGDSPPVPGKMLQQRRVARFVVDGHLGKLARDLRLLGFDVTYSSNAEDNALLAAATEQDRALLTRDRRLLMYRVVRHGYCPRSSDVAEQIIEVIRRFELAELLAPYARCIRCNGLLRRVNKSDVLDHLEPLTRIYYAASRIEKIRARLNRESALQI